MRGGQIASSVLRNLLGIPLYFLGLVLAWQAPAPLLFDPGTATQVAAWALIVTGSIPVVVGHLQIGWSTHMPSLRDPLVTTGLYAHVRHPIYAGALPLFIGLALVRPSATFALACALSCAFFIIQARLEEVDLLERLPEYREYMRRVPALLPHPGIKQPAAASLGVTLGSAAGGLLFDAAALSGVPFVLTAGLTVLGFLLSLGLPHLLAPPNSCSRSVSA